MTAAEAVLALLGAGLVGGLAVVLSRAHGLCWAWPDRAVVATGLVALLALAVALGVVGCSAAAVVPATEIRAPFVPALPAGMREVLAEVS